MKKPQVCKAQICISKTCTYIFPIFAFLVKGKNGFLPET